ncbi:MAG: pyridoxal phosphate-dependent aminotransferase [Candidatus Hodarchaeales archaeon]
MQYNQFINPIVLETPISGIRLVNSWESKISPKDQIHLNIGQPDLPTPSYIKEAVVEALERNLTRYTNVLGEKYLRDAIVEFQKAFHNLNYSANEVLVTAGGQSAIFAILKSILSPNDNVIVPFPSYPPYINAIKYNHANIIPLITTVNDNFNLSIDDLRSILENTQVKALLLISPSNPTGTIIPRSTLKEIVNLAIEFNFLIISDEIYSDIIFDNCTYTSIATFPEAWERTIIIQSFSKMLSMCGFRIGYTLAPTPIINQIKVIHHTMNICANSSAQYSAYKALKNDDQLKKSMSEMLNTYQDRRDLCLEILGQSGDFSISKPRGAFYIFPKANNLDMTIFCKWMKYNYGVTTVPGSYFSTEQIDEHNQYFRISFTAEEEKLHLGMNKILSALENYKKTHSKD